MPEAGVTGATYVPALDGLRALCIAAVVLYHLRPTGWFSGGFLGVSVFFTLSGFLITRNLVSELMVVGRVDVMRFWSRRVQRLAPAALATIVAVVLVTRLTERGWSERGLARDATAAVWSVTNWNIIALGRRNVLLILGPLVPMWSLAIEEQFYLGIALVFVAVAGRSSLRTLAIVLAAVGVASVVLAASLGTFAPRLEFGTDTRAAELAVGALLAVHSVRRPALFTGRVPLTRAVGAACLVALVLLFLGAGPQRARLFSGPIVLVAVLAAGVIVALMTGGALARAASRPSLVALGRMSYALYLVHWPIILVTHDPLLGLTGVPATIVRAALCLGCAWVLHVAVEQPLRRWRASPPTVLASWVLASVAVTVAASLLL